MLIKGITDEDFVNYKVPSMYIATSTCSFKCDKEYGKPICQNSELAKQPDIDINAYDIVHRYYNNPITHAMVIGGLEPFDQFDDLEVLLFSLRLFDHQKSKDPVVIYTGYTKKEIEQIAHNHRPDISIGFDKWFDEGPLIIKFGRYIPNQQPHFDPILGVYLASDNQYAERIS